MARKGKPKGPGGARPGAGRPPSDDPGVQITIRLKQSLLEQVESMDGARNANINDLVGEALAARTWLRISPDRKSTRLKG